LSKVIFLQGRLSCIRTMCPAHLSLVILTVVTKSGSSRRWYSSSLYLDLHAAPSQIGQPDHHQASYICIGLLYYNTFWDPKLFYKMLL
jgi:hypothetical protein